MKKKGIIQVLAFLLSVSILGQQCAGALGTSVYESRIPIGSGSELIENVYLYSERQEEHIIEYTPNEEVIPVVVYGSKVCNYGRFSSMAELLEKENMHAIGGINGDYYNLATYQPIGLVITDGILRSSDGGFDAIGFRKDGTAIIGKPELSAQITLSDRTYRVYGINKEITDDDFYLYSDCYSYTTKNSVPTINVVLSPPEGYELILNSEADFTVEEVVECSSELYMREGKYILSLKQGSSAWRTDGVLALKEGDTVHFSLSANEEWNEVQYAVGSFYRLISDGELITDVSDKSTAPRTAIGIKNDGKTVFYTVDGRQSGYSKGLTIEETAERMAELGCTDACLLDGGGSTNLHAQYIGDTEASQINKPSGGKERSVSNYIMLASSKPGDGEIHYLALYPNDPLVLSGSEVLFTPAFADSSSYPVQSDDEVVWSLEGAGELGENGKYIADETGTAVLTAALGDIKDTACITVIASPNSIKLFNAGSEVKSLTVYNGDTISLTAKAEYEGISVLSSNKAYLWSCSEEIGLMDEEGNFTAGDYSGSGFITAAAGDCQRKIPVTVVSRSTLIDGFEGGETSETAFYGNMEYVYKGYGSLKMDYCGETVYELKESVPDYARFISLRVYGDGNNEKLSLLFSDGEIQEIGIIDFTGWKRMTVPAPESTVISGIVVEGTGNGTIYIDHLMASTTPQEDTKAPELSITENNGTIKAVITDDCDAVLKKQNIEVLFDGVPADFSFVENKGEVSLTADYSQGTHLVSIKVRDESGNAAASSLLLCGAEEGFQFEDTSGHWAERYIAYMYSIGVVNGMDEYTFSPDSKVTRAQCAAMLCRLLKIDTDKYADTELIFTDTDKIPEYALDYVKAVYSLGIITGMDDGDGVRFAPDEPLTREQAMTVIGRIQQKGYPSAGLDGFIDGDTVQFWAEEYVCQLIGRGVINGFEDGSLRPAEPVTRAQLVKLLTEAC